MRKIIVFCFNIQGIIEEPDTVLVRYVLKQTWVVQGPVTNDLILFIGTVGPCCQGHYL